MARLTFEQALYSVQEGESALDALVRGGANVSFSCRKGSCHVCMLRASKGEPGVDAQRGLRDELRARGYFLPCLARPRGDITIVRPDPAELFVRAMVQEKEQLAPDVVRLSLEPETQVRWRAGQHVNVRRPSDGAVRSYSLASIPEEDYYAELHVRRVSDGDVSRWLCDRVEVGEELEIQGPVGSCFYDVTGREVPMLLVGGGTGLAPLVGIARDALRAGHRGPIELFHGARTREGLYLHDKLRALAGAHPSFRYVPCVSDGDPGPDATRGLVTDVAFGSRADLSGWIVYLAGAPAMVHAARPRAFAMGVRREDIRADPFVGGPPFVPDDHAKIRGLPPEPELWAALREGLGLREILEDFYDRVFEDPRLAPFFHNVTKRRAIEKQYEFLSLIFLGKTGFFGLHPFNAHHWMVISDELFDYRERLMESCMRRYGLAEHLIRRWGVVHEQFRRELVKSAPRGMILDGKELPFEGFSEETLSIGCLCDGCSAEMAIGEVGRMHVRTGQLFCRGCWAQKAGATLKPPV